MLATALFACGEPGATSAVTGGGSGLPIGLGDVATYGIAVSIIAAGLLALALLVAFARRGGPAPVPVPIGATLSPDGLYWWDGATWRPTH